MLGFAIERLWRFAKARRESIRVAIGVTPLLKAHLLDDAIEFTQRIEFKHSHLARVLTAGLTEFLYERSQEMLPPDYDIVDAGKRAIERETLMTTAEMKKGLGSLATISTTAPFIGLFGTVIGIYRALIKIGVAGRPPT